MKGSWSKSLGWTLQFLALVIVGTALLVGLVYDALRTEVAMLAVGGGLFLLGRQLLGSE
ncbi:MAG: hypothetical protein O7A98_00740 [Acidobacteria bacterium]|nr:hypothetical protein [Acidobacteriota bacterium]MCZ6725860.1 hypothetical protein [Acidobacteriota bacterium]